MPKSDGSRPLMDLPDDLPQDIDYDVYIKKTKELLKTIGFCLGKKGEVNA